MTDVWSDRAEAYRTSPVHASGEDLDLVIEWCEPFNGRDGKYHDKRAAM